jgi:hypothetical protein
MAEFYIFFDNILSLKYIDCKQVKKVDFPNNINKIILKINDNQKKLLKKVYIK